MYISLLTQDTSVKDRLSSLSLTDISDKVTINCIVSKSKISIDSNIYTIRYESDHNDQRTSRILSELKDSILDVYSSDVVILTDGPSMYFHERLYPNINSLENTLHTLIKVQAYSYLSDDSSIITLVEDLNNTSYIDLLQLITQDRDIINELKQVTCFNSLNDNWSKVLSTLQLDTFKDSINKLSEYRSKVIFGRPMSYKEFIEANKLFIKANTTADLLTRSPLFNKYEVDNKTLIKMATSYLNALSQTNIAKHILDKHTEDKPEAKKTLTTLKKIIKVLNTIAE